MKKRSIYALVGLQIVLLLNCHFPNANSLLVRDRRGGELTIALMEAEQKFWRMHGRYAQLAELGPAGAKLISKDAANGKEAGYFVRVTIMRHGFMVTTWPESRGSTGIRSFFADQTGIVRHKVSDGLANESSPKVEDPPD